LLLLDKLLDAAQFVVVKPALEVDGRQSLICVLLR
jgi:hypothetical protein